MTTESNDRPDQQGASEASRETAVSHAPPVAPSRGGTRTVLAATGIAVGSVLLLGAGETVIGQGDDFIAHGDFRGGYARQTAVTTQHVARMRRAG
mgnify:CR=1 FL=1